MGNEREIWQALGIGRTHDLRAIRTAYTRKLEAVDVDARPVAYIDLRLAYESALAAVRGMRLVGSWQDGGIDGAPVPREHAPVGEWFAVELPPRAVGLPDLLPELNELDRLFATVAAEHRRWLSADEKAELRRCWSAIAAAADAGSDADRAVIERAVGWLIVNYGPLAVGLVLFAVEHFRWEKVTEEAAVDGIRAEILWRYRGIQLLRRVRHPGHPYHPAWAELTTPAFAGSSRGRCNPKLVHELQAVARTVWPEVESEFDAGRVALWRNNTADISHPENLETRAPYGPFKTTGIVIGALFMLWGIFYIFMRAATGR